jgi:hypothetical protein
MAAEAGDGGPSAVLSAIDETLKARTGVDQELASVLARHILTVSPGQRSVEDAQKEIAVLARKRAEPVGEVAHDK